VFQLLAIGGMGRVIGWTINRPLLLAIGKPRLSLYSTLAASILLVMGTLLAAQVSLVAVAAVNAVVWAAFVPVNVLVVSRTLGISAMHTLWQVLRAVSIAALAGLPALVVTMELTGELPDLALAALSIVVYAVVHAGLVRALLRRRNQASVSSPAS
jgi:O-antigen/teichoic acid export membrane protein